MPLPFVPSASISPEDPKGIMDLIKRAYSGATGGTGNPEDMMWMARYGVSGPEKYRRVLSSSIPGSNPRNLSTEAGMDTEERNASGYLFGRQWPSIAAPATQGASFIRDVLGEHNPSLHATAMDATSRGVADEVARRKRRPDDEVGASLGDATSIPNPRY